MSYLLSAASGGHIVPYWPIWPTG